MRAGVGTDGVKDYCYMERKKRAGCCGGEEDNSDQLPQAGSGPIIAAADEQDHVDR